MPSKRTRLLLLLALPLLLTDCARRPILDAPRPVRDLYADAREIWPAPKDLEARMVAAGITPARAGEETYHIHAQLEVFKDGRMVIVPANIGTGPDVAEHSPLHTHLNTGVLHVEAPVETRVTLGQFFTLWNVPLDGARAIVNGQPVSDPAAVELTNNDLISVYFGEPPAHLQVLN